MTSPSEDHAAPETEATRHFYAEVLAEVSEIMRNEIPDEPNTIQMGYQRGMYRVLHVMAQVIERGGAQPEGEQQ